MNPLITETIKNQLYRDENSLFDEAKIYFQEYEAPPYQPSSGPAIGR